MSEFEYSIHTVGNTNPLWFSQFIVLILMFPTKVEEIALEA